MALTRTLDLATSLDLLVQAAIARHDFNNTLEVDNHPTITRDRIMRRAEAHQRYRTALSQYWATVTMHDAETLDAAHALALYGMLPALRDTIERMEAHGELGTTRALSDFITKELDQ